MRMDPVGSVDQHVGRHRLVIGCTNPLGLHALAGPHLHGGGLVAERLLELVALDQRQHAGDLVVGRQLRNVMALR